MIDRITRALHHLRWLWYVILLATFSQAVLWGMDFRPPIAILSSTSTPAYPGGHTEVLTEVRRDMTRNCSLTSTRYLIDSRSFRSDLPGSSLSAYDLVELERTSKNLSRISLEVPLGVYPGMASLHTSLTYTCNPLHRVLGGIVVVFERPILILRPPGR